MIQITSSPTYTQTNAEVGVFKYNVLAVMNNITYGFKSLQSRLFSAERSEGNFAIITLRENITDYLGLVAQTTGAQPIVYISDNEVDAVDYTGPYVSTNIQTVDIPTLGSVTQFTAKGIDSEAPTYIGDKLFDDAFTSQLVYKYRNVFTFEVKDVTRVSSTNRNKVISTIRQQSNADGTSTLNISEIARGYTPDIGTLTLQVRVTETDYYGNASTLIAPLANFVDGRFSKQNYGDWTLFNPDTKGSILPSTGFEVLYSRNEIYPIWVNFIANEAISTAEKMTLVVNTYQDTLAGVVRVDIPIQIGLNSIDISQFKEVVDLVLTTQPSRIGFAVEMSTVTKGQFGNQFGNQFLRISDIISVVQQSSEYIISARSYTLDNRRDFYFVFDNGFGGKSTYLCSQFTKTTEPEIVALRNQNTISNSVARETESVDLVFKQENIRALRFILGYDVNKLIKEGGIYESKNVIRIGEKGDTKQWIIKPSNYSLNNSDVFKDLNLSLYRPLFSGFETPIPARLTISDVEPSALSALVLVLITQQSDIILERGIIIGKTAYPSTSNSLAFGVAVQGLTSSTKYTVRAYARTNFATYYSYPTTFTTTAE